jgi:hypothetical protein
MQSTFQSPTVQKNPPIILSEIVLTPDSEGKVTIRGQISSDAPLKIYIDDVLQTEPIRINSMTEEWSIRLPLESGTYLLRIEDPDADSVETDLVVLEPSEG